MKSIFVGLVLLLLMTVVPGCGTPSFLITPVSNSNSLQEMVVRPSRGWGGDKVAIIEVEGLLVNARTGGFLQATENKVSLFLQELDRAAQDRSVKAVVLRVNSPGGTVVASDIMYQAICEFREKTGKPVVASTQEVAASGAYYVSLAADRIVAHPTSVVGSIGVIFNTLEFEGALAKLGIRSNAIKSGPLKDMGSPLRAMGDVERGVMQNMVDEYYARFVGLVKLRRPIRDEKTLATVTDGRVFTGEQAAKLGLADQTGRLDEAIALAQTLGGTSSAKIILYKRPYGYGGSIYADAPLPPPQAQGVAPASLQVDIPIGQSKLPGGFYYLWEPGM